MTSGPAFWAVVPAAGTGSRMGAATPKQYLALAGQAVLQRSIDALLAFESMSAVVVALADGDPFWDALPAARDARVITTLGGAERGDSVLAGLDSLAGRAQADDWVLVHDAARPCLASEDLQRLVETVCEDPVGGLLAIPVVETVKRSDAGQRVAETVPRGDLWLAQTPQMFRYGLLRAALAGAVAQSVTVTDEASALEWAGHRPCLVPGRASNIKITLPGDLRLAEHFIDSIRDDRE